MMRTLQGLIALPFVLAAAASLSAQDTIRFKDGKEVQGDIVNLNYKVVEYNIDIGNSVAKQPADAKNIVEIVPDNNRKTFDFASGETAMNGGDFDSALERFDRVRRDQRSSDLLKQLASINIVKCQWGKDNAAGVLSSVKALREQRADSFFLRDSYEYEVKAHLSKKDVNAAKAAIAAFEEKGKADGMPEWAKSAELMRAGLAELQNDFRAALAIHRKYARDKDVGEEATLGELRCLVATNDWTQAGAKAELVINDGKGKKVVNQRLLTGAFNARGEMNLNSGKFKEALLDFLQGAMALNKSGETTREHEVSLARGALACAKLASAQTDKSKKEAYKHRAQELLGDLDKIYPGSSLRGEAAKAIQEVK